MTTPNSRYWFSVSEAGDFLAVDSATVRGWARRVLEGEPSRLTKAKLHDGRYFVSRREVAKLLRKSRV